MQKHRSKRAQYISHVVLPWLDQLYQPTSDLHIDSLQHCNRTWCFCSIRPADFRS
ncbi:unnamed protein product [Arabidopsis thaliana]|uniref:Uncharacterized protein n=2 Tax=Arabidopsis thaliana TaxID=3702 RepID=A0A654EDY6_ARATH|nr:uncharacterized protein AT1G26225 [Arabidopsis thaliana]ANM61039.1 hypothetical protein AT1G26225 [Arabidopsis thaliana]CAA0242803.1 unnamed protein product [Arabidopsis thaliana]VYS47185.1 unnamed protein product [Arabidopsis thaliana]|eukprot:NP_001323283.1 hypothetical protein AT1G26225 [Arabidopsis thaliana]